jgi:membrane protein implicated in regulation of membrane protease activity
MGKFAETWNVKSTAAKVLFILSILYAVSSINVLLLALGIVQWVPGMAFNLTVMITYCLVSFTYGLIVSAYHLYTFLNRRKRKDDNDAEEAA